MACFSAKFRSRCRADFYNERISNTSLGSFSIRRDFDRLPQDAPRLEDGRVRVNAALIR